MFTVVPEGVEDAEDLSLLKDKQSTDPQHFLGYSADRCSFWLGIVGCFTWLKFSMSRFACQALAVHSHGSSGNLDALRFQSRIQGPRDWQLRHRIVRYGFTVLIQSCSVTTSTLTPLVVVGHLRLVKVYPFTVGANVRTTVTGFRHDSCAVSPLLRTGKSAHLVPTAIWSGRRTFDVEILGKHRSRQSVLFFSGALCTCSLRFMS